MTFKDIVERRKKARKERKGFKRIVKKESLQVRRKAQHEEALKVAEIKGKARPTIQQLPKLLNDAAKILKNYKISFEHNKKDKSQIIDDIQGNVKMILVKSLKGNDNFLFLGKFRVLTKMHYKIIQDGLRLTDGGVVCIVTSKDTKFSQELRTKMLSKSFPNIEIIHHSTGNLFGIMGKAESNINIVLAGSDRVQSYREMLKSNPDIRVKEIQRNDSDISASKVIAQLDDEEYFMKNTPKEIHSMYNEIKNTYKD
jgi:hypothetical protein